MIIDIKKGQYAMGLIKYNESKVRQGRGERIYDNTLATNTNERISYFLAIADMNTRVYRNRFAHFSISFNEADRKLTPEEFIPMGERYLSEMGYRDVPILMYEHYDTGHQHFHLVVTTTDFDGKKIKEFNDHERSQLISRQMETDYNLTPTTYQKKGNEKLTELNAKKYSLDEALRNPSQEHQRALASLNPYHQELLANDPKTNEQLQSYFKLRDPSGKTLRDIYAYLRKHKLVKKSNKSQLLEKLQYIRSYSTSPNEFLANLEKQGIYHRLLYDNKQQVSMTYGIKELEFYISDKHLPPSLRWPNLYSPEREKNGFSLAEQQRFLKKLVGRAYRYTSSLPEFEQYLAQRDIKVIYASNSAGIYGISFQSARIADPITCKGSDIDMSWAKLRTIDMKPQYNQRPPEVSTTDTSLSGVARTLDTSSDDGDRRRKDENKDLEKD